MSVISRHGFYPYEYSIDGYRCYIFTSVVIIWFTCCGFNINLWTLLDVISVTILGGIAFIGIITGVVGLVALVSLSSSISIEEAWYWCEGGI